MNDDNRALEGLVDRYLAAVRRHLADRKESADIVAELGEAVRSQVEAKEAELGRPLDKTEAAAVVKTFGSPMLAAARYRGQEYLIGPDLYPYYWPVARIVIGVVAALAIVGSLAPAVFTDKPVAVVLRGLSFAWNGALISFAIVTVIFIILEQMKSGSKIEAAWRPESLPRDTANKPKSIFESVFSLAWDAVFIAWWVGLLSFPNTIPAKDHSVLHVDLMPIWASLYWPVLAMMLISAAIHLADVLHPTWSRARSVVYGAGHVIGLYVLWALAHAGRLVTVSGEAMAAEPVAKLQGVIDLVLQMAIYFTALGFAVALVIELWRLSRSLRMKAPPASLAV